MWSPARAESDRPMNLYSYQHEKMSEAIHFHYLMLPDVVVAKKLVAAMVEFSHAFHSNLPSDAAFGHFDKIKQIMVSGPGRSRRRSSRHLNAARSSRRSRDYYTYEARR